MRWRWAAHSLSNVRQAGFVMILLALPAFAELGGNVSTVQNDQVRMKGTVRVTAGQGFAIHEITTPTGTAVREYVNSAGTVFGVAWQGPWKPDLRQLLGAYFDQYVQASQENKKHGRSPLQVKSDSLVVHSGGHPRAFSGSAFLPQMMPPNVTPEMIQ